jgi:integrase
MIGGAMATRELAPGEHGEITLTPQRRDADGKWKTCPNARQAERWRARAYYRDLHGVRGEVTKVGPTKGKADTLCEEELKRRTSANQHADNPYLTRTTPFGEAVAHWLTEAQRSDSKLSPRSVADYTRVVKRHIAEPGEGLRKALKERNAGVRDVRLIDVNDTQRLTRYLQAVADVHGTSSAKVTRSVIANVLNLAVRYGVLSTSALPNVPQVASQTPRALKPGREARDTRRAFTREERAVLIDHADTKAMEEPYLPRTRRKWSTAADLLAFMAGTGARVTEARSLQWENVDEGCTGAVVIGKGHRGEPRPRHVNFSASLTERMKRRQAETGGAGYVFSSPAYLDHEHEWDQSNCAKSLSALLCGAGFTWATPHSLRRTAATLAHTGGAPLIDIADQLGHANPTMTGRVYLGRNWMGERRSVADLL